MDRNNGEVKGGRQGVIKGQRWGMGLWVNDGDGERCHPSLSKLRPLRRLFENNRGSIEIGMQ